MSGRVFPDSAQYRSDFDWLISCPSLLDSPEVLNTALPAVDGPLDFEGVERFLASKASYRVGYYAESLIEVWLQSVRRAGEIEQSLQIQEGNRTVGELDFLYRLGGALHHLEVALKFYLYFTGDHSTGSHYIGPNAADTFERKREKLLSSQVALGVERIPELAASEVIMKGMIFYPPEGAPSVAMPEGLNPVHRRGVWIRSSQLDWLDQDEGMSFGCILEKPFWLSGSPFHESVENLKRTVRLHFEVRDHPLLISLADKNGTETKRVFVVGEQWPA